MRKRCLAGLFLVLAVLLAPATSTAEDAPGLTGRVLDPDGTPITGAGVVVIGPDSKSGVNYVPVQEDGSFLLRKLPPGLVTLTFKADGYESLERRIEPGSGEGPLVVVLPREDFRRCRAPAPEHESPQAAVDPEIPRVSLAEPGSAEVQLVDREGWPISGATVHANVWLGTVTTAVGGTARFASLPSNKALWLLIERKGFVSEVRSLKLRPGEHLDLRITLLPGVRARGQVVDESGRPVAGAGVALSGHLPGTELLDDPSGFLRSRKTRRTRTDHAGRFRFDDLPEGDVTLLLQDPSFVPRREVHPLAPIEDNDLGRIVLRRGLPLAGRVTDRDGRPVEGMPLRAFLPGVERDEEPAVFSLTGLDGTFFLPHVPEGGIRLSACREDYRPLTVCVRPADQPVHLTVSPGATLRGRVLDASGRPEAGAEVRPSTARIDPLALYDRDHWTPCFPRPATTDADGRFSVGPLPPDWYDLEATDGWRSGRARMLRAAAGVAVEGIEIRLDRSAATSGQVPTEPSNQASSRPGPSPGAAVTGRVLGLTGDEPGPDDRVILSGDDHQLFAALGTNGTFRLRNVPPGTWELFTRVTGRQAKATVVVPPGSAEVRAELQLPAAHPVSGRVLDDLARPVAGARVTAWGTAGEIGVEARADGSFLFLLPDGVYDLLGTESGFHGNKLNGLQVRGGAVKDLEIRLKRYPPSTALRGRLLGILPGDRPELKATAIRPTRPGGGHTAEVALDTYSLPGLEPGLWSLEARSFACTLRRTIEVPPGVTEMEMDLDFTPEAKPREEGAPSEDWSALLWGRVIGPDGAPVAGAEVTTLQSGKETRSAADGSFELRLPKLQAEEVTARRPGLAAGAVVIPGVPAEPIEIRLAPDASIAGHVLGLAASEPGGESVWLTSPGGPFLSAPIRADGTFEATQVPPGLWDLETTVSGREAHALVVLLPGQKKVCADLVLPPVHSVSGRVVDELGRPLEKVEIVAWWEMKGEVTTTETEPDGRFALLLPDGGYNLYIRKAGFQEGEVAGFRVQGAPVEALSFRLERATDAIVRGQVFGPDGEPLAGATVHACTVEEVLYGSTDDEGSPCEDDKAVTAGDEGRFVLHLPWPGWYEIRARHSGLVEGVASRVRAALGDGNETLKLQLRRGTVVTGRVIDEAGEPVAGAGIQGWTGAGLARTVTGGDGSFRLEGMGAGRGGIRAEAPGYWMGSTFLQVEDDEEPKELDLPVVLQKIPPGEDPDPDDEGRAVIPAEVDPPGGVKVTGIFRDLKPGEISHIVITRGLWPWRANVELDGRWWVEDLSPGTWKVKAHLGRGLDPPSFSKTFEIPPGVTEMHLELRFGDGEEAEEVPR